MLHLGLLKMGNTKLTTIINHLWANIETSKLPGVLLVDPVVFQKCPHLGPVISAHNKSRPWDGPNETTWFMIIAGIQEGIIALHLSAEK